MRRFKGITYIILGLATIGLFSMLFNNPIGLFKLLLGLVIFGVVIFTLINIFRNRNSSSNEMQKYKRALKQSKQRYQHHQTSNHRPQREPNKLRRTRQRPTHLRVIEGQKSKDKNRATF